MIERALILKISRFCLEDGPGIRTSVFFKGCNLHCPWCHNPESLDYVRQLMLFNDKCSRCGICRTVCPKGAHKFDGGHHIDYKLCAMCGKCEDACPEGALMISGHYMTVEEILRIILKDKPYYQTSGGGVTLTGGEALNQFDFALRLAKAVKQNNIHLSLETSGFIPKENFKKFCQYLDLLLFDCKLTSPLSLKKYTGADGDLIFHNLKTANKLNVPVILRCPLIPSVNDSEEHFSNVAKIINSNENIISAEILPYHELGINKYKALNKPFHEFTPPEKERTEYFVRLLRSLVRVPVSSPSLSLD